MANDTTVKFRVDISELQKKIQEANRLIRLANSEFKAASAGLDDWTKSADGVSEKSKQLTDVLKLQKDILEKLTKQHELVAAAEGESSRGAQELQIKINNQRAVVTKAEKALDSFNKEFDDFIETGKDAEDATKDLRTTTEKLRDTIKDQQTELKNLQGAYSDLVLEEKEGTDEAKELADKIKKLSSELDENKEKLKAAETATKDLTAVEEEAEESKDDLRTASEKLKDTIDRQQTELDELKTKYMDVVLEEGRYSDSAQELAGEIDKLSTELNDNQRELQETEDAADDLDNTLENVEDGLEPVSGGFTVLKGALSDLVADGIRKAIDGFKDLMQAGIDYESAFTSVKKTVDETEEGYARLDKGIKDMSTQMPQSAADIAEVAAAAGQLGVDGVDNILDFTKVMIMLGDATDLSSEDAASMFARFANITGLDFKNISNLGSTVTALGNNFATTESEIGNMALRLAGAGTQVGMTEPQILAMAAALSSVGIESEAGGSAFSKLMSKIAVEVAKAGPHLEQYAEVAGMSAEQFSEAFEKDALGAIQAFLGGINEMDGNDAIVILDEMELSEVRLRDAILRSSGALDNFNDAIDLANTSWDENTALQNEAQQRYETTASQIEIMKNRFRNAGTTLLETFAPAIETGISFLEKLADALEWIIENSTGIITAITSIGVAIGTFLAIVNRQAILTAFIGLLMKLRTAIMGVFAVMAANPIALVIAAIAGLVTAFIILWNKSEKFRNFWIGLWESIKETVNNAVDTVIGIWNTLSEIFSGIWDSIMETMYGFFDWVVENFTIAKEGIIKAWNTLSEFFSGLLKDAKEIFGVVADWINENVIQPIIEFFQPLITFFTELFQILAELGEGCWNALVLIWGQVSTWFNENVIEPVKTFFTQLWNDIVQWGLSAWEDLKEIWNIVSTWFSENVIEPVKTFFSNLWNDISEWASASWEDIKKVWKIFSTWFNNSVIQPTVKFFTGMWDGIKRAAYDAWEGIKLVFAPVAEWFEGKFRNAWQKVKAVFSTGGQIFEGIKAGITEAFKTVVNGIIRGINNVVAIPFNAINSTLDKIRNISIAGAEPFKNLVTRFTVPQIPELAKGGVLRKGQVGLLEGDGAEAVVPLEKNTRWLDEIASRLSNKLERNPISRHDTKQTTVVNNNFYQTNNSPKSLSRLEIYRQSKNLLRMKGA